MVTKIFGHNKVPLVKKAFYFYLRPHLQRDTRIKVNAELEFSVKGQCPVPLAEFSQQSKNC